MRIALLGLPGSGKTSLALDLARKLEIPHIEADRIFWAGRNLRAEARNLVELKDWIFDGHMSKVSDLVLPKADHIIYVKHPEMSCLLRVLKRDRNFHRSIHNVLHFYTIRDRMHELVRNQKKILVWENEQSLDKLLDYFTNLN